MLPAVLVSKYRRGSVCIWANISSRMCFWVPWLTLTIRNSEQEGRDHAHRKDAGKLAEISPQGRKIRRAIPHHRQDIAVHQCAEGAAAGGLGDGVGDDAQQHHAQSGKIGLHVAQQPQQGLPGVLGFAAVAAHSDRRHYSSPPFCWESVDFLINFRRGLQQGFVGAYVFHHAAVQHDDDVRILHGGDPLGDDELGGAGNLLPERLDGSWRRYGCPRRRWSRPESESWAFSAAHGRCKDAASDRRTRWCRPAQCGCRSRRGSSWINSSALGQTGRREPAPRRWRWGCPSAGFP